LFWLIWSWEDGFSHILRTWGDLSCQPELSPIFIHVFSPPSALEKVQLCFLCDYFLFYRVDAMLSVDCLQSFFFFLFFKKFYSGCGCLLVVAQHDGKENNQPILARSLPDVQQG
jgi:hypothetical protein